MYFILPNIESLLVSFYCSYRLYNAFYLILHEFGFSYLFMFVYTFYSYDAGFQSYLVGGCVRDLVLNKIPKDYDVITTANLKQVL